jgi:hypothetical protein
MFWIFSKMAAIFVGILFLFAIYTMIGSSADCGCCGDSGVNCPCCPAGNDLVQASPVTSIKFTPVSMPGDCSNAVVEQTVTWNCGVSESGTAGWDHNFSFRLRCDGTTWVAEYRGDDGPPTDWTAVTLEDAICPVCDPEQVGEVTGYFSTTVPWYCETSGGNVPFDVLVEVFITGQCIE